VVDDSDIILFNACSLLNFQMNSTIYQALGSQNINSF